MKHPGNVTDFANTRRGDGLFYGAMGLVAFGVVFAGFGQSFYRIVSGRSSLPALVIVHSLAFSAWLVLFVVQTALVARKNISLHRKLGAAAAGLAIAMVVIGYQTSISGIRRGFDLSGRNDPLAYSVFPLGDLVSFTVLVYAGYWFRKQSETHKRLMLLATVGTLLNAPLAHFIAHVPALESRGPLVILPMMIVLLFASAVYDRAAYGRVHRVSLWVATGLFLYGNLRAGLIGPSKAWHDFAAWLAA